MKVTLVPSSVSVGDQESRQFLSSYLINDTLAIDAGCLGFFRSPQEQARIKHILLSHSHIDHLASLPMFLENVYDTQSSPVTIYASEPVLDCLRSDLFNGRLWPDFIALSHQRAPYLIMERLLPGKPVDLEGLRITPVPVNHVVPTLGFIVEEPQAAVIVSSDTGPTDELWDCANRTSQLKAVFLEATFPDSMADLAAAAKHLTPATFAAEVWKLTRSVRVIAVHIKARFYARVISELRALGLPNLEIAQFTGPYVF